MLDCIFTLDYEIYGNGEGSLRELVFDPAERLIAIFQGQGVPFVNFVEVAELAKIQKAGADPAIGNVRDQLREMYKRGFEIALHLHPQWSNATYKSGRWLLDYSEYNLCALPSERITEIVGGAIAYLRDVLEAPSFSPLAFRAGNWLFQPTATAARVLFEHGIRIDSSVFKGGLQHKHHLDYRAASKNSFFWRFEDDVTRAEPKGRMLEVPIYTRQVPFWKMATGKRLSLQRKGSASPKRAKDRFYRLLDLARFSHPLKFDFCRMTLKEMVEMMEPLLGEDSKAPDVYRPLVAIGHTKDLTDFKAIDSFLDYLQSKHIAISTFAEVQRRCAHNSFAGREVAFA